MTCLVYPPVEAGHLRVWRRRDRELPSARCCRGDEGGGLAYAMRCLPALSSLLTQLLSCSVEFVTFSASIVGSVVQGYCIANFLLTAVLPNS